MIDFFVGNYVSQNKENFHIETNTVQYDQRLVLISFVISIFAAWLAFSCNKRETTGVKWFHTFLGYVFGSLYLVYYAIVHMLLGKKC
jgi:uncharacterized protein YybS (DUF2232 family)